MTTRVGADGWREIEIGELNAAVTSGSRGWGKYYSDAGDLFIRITNLSRSNINLDLSNSKFVRLPNEEREGLRTSVQNGDVLISITADIGIAGIVDDSVPKPAYINQHIASVRFPIGIADGRFVAYYLASEGPQKRFCAMTDTGAKAGMSLGAVRKIRFQCPPLAEQQRIASALKDIDDLIASLDALIAKKRDIKQAAMQQLLTGKTRLPGFDGAWKEATLRDVTSQSVTYGIVKAGEFQNDGVRMLRGGDISDGSITGDPPFVTEEKSQEFGRTVLQENDVVVALVGYPGEAAVIPDWLVGGNISRAVGLIRPSPRLNSRYLAHYLNSPDGRKSFLRPSAGSAQIVVNLKDLNALPLAVPDIAEQEAIADAADEFDRDLRANIRKRDKLGALKGGMMQQLLTGRIRLV